MIPSRLQLFGLTNSSALSIYGVLTGMAMPFLFFPSTLTNSAAVMLLPAVSRAQSNEQNHTIHHASNLSIRFCLWLGIFCTGVFLLFGKDMGSLIFHSELAGKLHHHFMLALSLSLSYYYNRKHTKWNRTYNYCIFSKYGVRNDSSRLRCFSYPSLWYYCLFMGCTF